MTICESTTQIAAFILMFIFYSIFNLSDVMTKIAVLQYFTANMLKKSGVLLQFRSVPNKKHRIIKQTLASKIPFFWWFYFTKV